MLAIIDYNKSGAILDLILGIVLLLLSLCLIYHVEIFGALAQITLYLAGIMLIVVGLVSLINNRQSRNGFYIGIAWSGSWFIIHSYWNIYRKSDYSRYINRIMVSDKRCFKINGWLKTVLKLSFFGVYIDWNKCRF